MFQTSPSTSLHLRELRGDGGDRPPVVEAQSPVPVFARRVVHDLDLYPHKPLLVLKECMYMTSTEKGARVASVRLMGGALREATTESVAHKRKMRRKEGRKEGRKEANEANLYVEHDVSKDGAAWEHEGGLAGKLHNRPGDHLVVHHVHLAAVAHHFGLLLGHRHDVQVY